MMSRGTKVIADSIRSTVTLNDNVKMPLFGLGVYQSKAGAETEKAVEYALKNNYVMIDTAALYKNESDVGKAIKKSGISRKDLFVVTKLWNSDHGYESTKKAFMQSLKNLDMDYIDLYLMHSPLSNKVTESYQAMLELKEKNLVRSVGVSNFGIHHLEGLKAAGKPVPSVNQIELHPWTPKNELVKYCWDNGIVPMGYAPLTQGKKLNDPTIVKLGEKYNKTPAQILLRWGVQKGFITIPKSVKEERVVENAQVFDFKISDDDMKLMESSFPEASFCWKPTESPWNG